MVERIADRLDWLKLAEEWGHTLRTERGDAHWQDQFRAIAECLPWRPDSAPEVLEMCPGSGVITEVLLETHPGLKRSLMEVQPIFKRMACENIRARSGREPAMFSAP